MTLPAQADEGHSLMQGRYRDSSNPRRVYSAYRSGALRWVWVVTIRLVESGQRDFFGPMAVDDYGNLFHIKGNPTYYVYGREVI